MKSLLGFFMSSTFRSDISGRNLRLFDPEANLYDSRLVTVGFP